MPKIIIAAFEGVTQKELKEFEKWLNRQLLLTPFKKWTIFLSRVEKEKKNG